MAAERSILLVDDDSLLLDSLVRILKMRFLVRTSTSPLRALETLRMYPKEFFAIISDVHMPEMDGPQFLERAARVAPMARTILMSGQLEADAVMRAVNGPGVFRVLQKPLAPPKLITALEDAWQSHQGLASASGTMRTPESVTGLRTG